MRVLPSTRELAFLSRVPLDPPPDSEPDHPEPTTRAVSGLKRVCQEPGTDVEPDEEDTP